MEKKNVKVVDAVNNKKKPKKKERICEIGYMMRMNCEVKMVKEILGTMMMEGLLARQNPNSKSWSILIVKMASTYWH